MGAGNKTHDYAIDISRQYGSGVYVVASEDGNSWTIRSSRVHAHIKSGTTGYWIRSLTTQ
jgi:hypothetical protein